VCGGGQLVTGSRTGALRGEIDLRHGQDYRINKAKGEAQRAKGKEQTALCPSLFALWPGHRGRTLNRIALGLFAS